MWADGQRRRGIGRDERRWQHIINSRRKRKFQQFWRVEKQELHEGTTTREYDDTDYNNGAFPKTNTARAIAKGEQQKNDAYFDKIYVAFWDGYNRQIGKLPRPILDKVELIDGFKAKYPPYSLRINTNETTDAYGYPLKYTHEIDTKKKYTFSFFADEIPDPHALFYIEGGKYIAEKITATFHENTGKSQLLKGVFYRVLD